MSWFGTRSKYLGWKPREIYRASEDINCHPRVNAYLVKRGDGDIECSIKIAQGYGEDAHTSRMTNCETRAT
jgi:hypothetical protein